MHGATVHKCPVLFTFKSSKVFYKSFTFYTNVLLYALTMVKSGELNV